MQIKSLRIQSYRSFKVDDSTPGEAVERLHRVETYQALRAEGCTQATALQAIGWSRSTYYRWHRRYQCEGVRGLIGQSRRPRRIRGVQWGRAEEHRVWALRRRYPFMGKARLHILLEREGLRLSASTVGRILTQGVRLGRIRPCAFCRGRTAVKRRRRFDGHAKRWRYGQRPRRAGELVQIDHMALYRDGQRLKEFKAISPIGKQLVARVYSQATANNAKRFLEALRTELPHALHSVQVDGGSEFMAEFEQACQDLDLALYVLPPRRPQYNGCVERANDTTRVEFWNLYDGAFTVDAANRALAEYQHFYHHVRPHQALDWKTPNEYLQYSRDCSTQSHMC